MGDFTKLQQKYAGAGGNYNIVIATHHLVSQKFRG